MTAERQGARPRAGSLLPLGWWKDPRWQMGAAERDLFTRLLSYSADFMTDGSIPSSIVQMLAFGSADGDAQVAYAVIVDLRDRGLIENDRAGVVIPADVYAEFNLTAAQVSARQEQRREAGRKRAERAARDPKTKRYRPDPANGPAAAGPPAGGKSQRRASEKASPILPAPGSRTPGNPAPGSPAPAEGTSSPPAPLKRADSVASNGLAPSRPGQEAQAVDGAKPAIVSTPSSKNGRNELSPLSETEVQALAADPGAVLHEPDR